MSYCRFSSEDFSCDLYIYEHYTGGYVVSVAKRKLKKEAPKLPSFSLENQEEFFEMYKKQMKFLETAEYEEIELPYAGETFFFDNLSDCIIRVEELVKLGYRIPDNLLLDLKEELSVYSSE